MADNERPTTFIISHKSSGIFVGLFLIALGVVWLLDQQGLVSAHRLFHFFWPALFIFFGLELLLGHHSESRGFGGFLFVIGALMLLGDLGYIPIHIGFATIWPILLVGIGVAILLGRFRGKSRRQRFWDNFVNNTASVGDTTNNPGPTVLGASWRKFGRHFSSEDSSINYSAVFAGIKHRITSKKFNGGNIVAVWGGFQLDLTGAEMEGDTAVIDMTMFMGGGELRIPEGWALDIQATAFMGAFRDETSRPNAPSAAPTKRLVIRGVAVMGGVVIKN